MKRVTITLLAAVTLLTVTTGPASATADGCTWNRAALPLPAGDTTGYVNGGATGGWLVGSGSTTAGARWHHGELEELGHAFGKPTELKDINSSGTSAGMTYGYSDPDGAIVHRNGQYTALPVPAGRRFPRAVALNDAGDVVGMANGIADNFDLLLWPAAQPGTVQVINPDPQAYGYVSPLDIDEQGRILVRASVSTTDFFVRYPDGTMTKLALNSTDVYAFRNGRITGEVYENGKFVTVDWDLTGQVIRRYDVPATDPVIDSGTRTTGVYRTADKGYALGVWDNGILTDTLLTSPDNTLGRPVLTDDGVIATTDDSTAAAVTFTRTCS